MLCKFSSNADCQALPFMYQFHNPINLRDSPLSNINIRHSDTSCLQLGRQMRESYFAVTLISHV
jgi:hypothetical protein